MLRRDYRLYVWRSIEGGTRLDGEAVWFIVKFIETTDDSGRESLEIVALSANVLLVNRVVAEKSGSSRAKFRSVEADTVMRTLVYNSFLGGSSESPSRAYRDLPESLFSVSSVSGTAPKITKQFSRKSVKDSLDDIVKECKQLGVVITYDVVYHTTKQLQFRVYLGARGVVRTANSRNPTILGRELGNLAGVSLEEDYSKQKTAVFVAGSGDGVDRLQLWTEDTSAVNESPFGRKEMSYDSRSSDNVTELLSAGYAQLAKNARKVKIKGKVLNIPSSRYAVHWGWGDRVTVVHKGEYYDVDITSVSVQYEAGEERIDVTLEI
jgi:hypothetical protein